MTGMPAPRAVASNLATFGIDAMQRGRRSVLHVCLLKSSISSAVVFGSTVTAFSAGAGGTFTVDHSSTIDAAPAVVTTNAIGSHRQATIRRSFMVVRSFIDALHGYAGP